MAIFLIRHTRVNVSKGVCYGQADVELAPDNITDFEQIKENIPLGDHVEYFSSPLKRCALLAQYFSNQVCYSDDLKELNFGSWELKKWESIPESELNTWMNDYINTAPPGGEKMADMIRRVQRFMSGINNSDSHKVIVTHAGVCKIVLGMHHQRPVKDWMDISVDFGEVIRLNEPDFA